MTQKDHYQILNIRREASQEEIKSAYILLAKKYHPDLNKIGKYNFENKMKELNLAYSVLSNPESRELYDSSLETNYNYFEEEVIEKENNPKKNKLLKGCLTELGEFIIYVIGGLIGIIIAKILELWLKS